MVSSSMSKLNTLPSDFKIRKINLLIFKIYLSLQWNSAVVFSFYLQELIISLNLNSLIK